MSPIRIGRVLVTLLAVAAVFTAGVVVGGHPRQSGLDRLPSSVRDRLVDEERTAIATQVLAILQDDYYKPIDESKLERASVEQLLATLADPYTQYLDPEDFDRFKDDRSGRYGGVGIEWHPQGAAAAIVRVFPGGPAAKADLRPKDRVVAVDGTTVTSKDRFAAMQTVKGPAGTTVTLGIVRPGSPRRDVALVRKEITREVVESRVESYRNMKIGYARLDQFTQGSAKALRAAVTGLREKKVAGIVFDLRGDGGGLVNEAVDVANVFLEDDTTIATTRGRAGPGETLTTQGRPVDTQIPLVVLVDGNSASASEIVAGALRDEGRATLVGATTFGKALIQSTRTLANGGALKLTVASYLTPNGFDLGMKGLPPDVPATDDPDTAAVDEALQTALAQVATR